MSFILDALKKAESERHRASGPVLVDVRLAPQRPGLPLWGWVLGGVLLGNLAVLGWLMLRKPVAHQAPTAPIAAAPQPASTPPAAAAASPPATAPAAVAAPAGASVPGSAPAGTTASSTVDVNGVPTLQELLAQGVALPPLLMNLHVYDATPALRFVMLNGVRLGEGEYTPDGIKVVAITEHGVVLDARGQRFLLPAGG